MYASYVLGLHLCVRSASYVHVQRIMLPALKCNAATPVQEAESSATVFCFAVILSLKLNDAPSPGEEVMHVDIT